MPGTRPSTLVVRPDRVRDEPPGARVARVLFVLAAFTSTWNAIGVGGGGQDAGLKPVDLLLLAACVVGSAVVLAHWRPLPGWLWLPATGVVVVLVVHVVFPTPIGYLEARLALDAIGESLPHQPDGLATAAVAVRWLIALLVVPLLAVNLYGKQRRPLDLLIWAWASGAALSGLVAVCDFSGLTQIGPSLVGFAEQAGRQTGLSIQPNHLGFSCALAAPAAVHLARRHRLLGTVVLASLLGGILVSGSRGAQLAVLVIGAVALLVFSSARRHLPAVAYGGSFVLVGLVLFGGHVLEQVGEVLRFGGDSAAASSDSIRLQIATQAVVDALHRPAFGVGYQVLLEAHSIYLQALASGGVLLLVCLVTIHLGALATSLRLARLGDALAPHLFACVLTWVVLGLIENQVTDRYLYFPIAAIAALAVSRHAPRPGAEDGG